MAMSSSFGSQDVTIRFVLPDLKANEDQCSDMKRAFQVCLDHSLGPRWIPEKECQLLHPSKGDVFVFEEFAGKIFGYLRSISCIRIIGPRCILDSLASDILIPERKFPLFTLAMRDLFVTVTGFSEPEKATLGEKIQYMGGVYSPEYRQSVTHLVANHLCSAKYEKALENHIPVMTEQWVDAVWEASKKRNVHANDKEFQKFKCPVFHKLIVTCSQLSRKQKEALKCNINNNGGEFCGELEAGRSNVLVVTKPFGDKFTHANIWKIPCVTLAWVTDSIERGHALRYADYMLSVERKCSTPTGFSELPGLPDMSASIINVPSTHVNETLQGSSSMASKISTPGIPPKNLESPKKHLQLINKINMSDVKKAGAFLDGCNVYLSGFRPVCPEKLRKILNSGGATRFNEISDSVTHVIIGEFVPSDIRILKSKGARLHVVTVEWIVESIRLRGTAPEDKFSCLNDLPSPNEFQSPLSKKGFLALHSQNEKHDPALGMESPKSIPKPSLIPKNLFDQYSQNSEEKSLENEAHSLSDAPANDRTGMQNHENTIVRLHCTHEEGSTENGMLSDATQMSSTNGSQAEFFSGITFSISGYTAIQTKEIERLIISSGGRIVSKRFKGIPDYGIVPVHGGTLFHTTTEIVTHLWLDDCAEEGMIIPVKYYHQPVNFDLKAKPLSNCVVTTTSYSGIELRFIAELLEGLGAVNQSMMARINRPSEKLLATTHVICPAGIDLSGSRKFKAACKWGIPSVSHDWLLSCAKERKCVDEEPFLVSSDSHDSSVVIAKTPMTHTTKRKCAEDNTVSRVEHRVSTMCPPVSNVLHSSNVPQLPHTPNHMTPKGAASPMLRTPRQGTSAANTPEDEAYDTPRSYGDIPTPDTPYGRVFKENPSPKTRKMWKKWIDQWPEEPEFKAPPPKQRRNSTPMAELIHQCWQKFAHEPYMKSFHRSAGDDDSESQIDDADRETGPHLADKMENNSEEPYKENDILTKTPSQASAGINTQLQELDQILDSATKANAGKRKELSNDNLSTPCTARNVLRTPESLDLCTELVEWVDPVISNQQNKLSNSTNKVFMLTAIDNREMCEEIIRSLGGIVYSSLNPAFDQTVTHLVCQQPSRNEKLLSSIASGKWVLEKRFLEDSKKKGHFVNEEYYEWGNPKATYLQNLVKPGSLNEQLAMAIYRWRCKIQASRKGAFSGMKAIVCSSEEKSELYKRIIVAGGGEVLNISPPFSEPGNATICILELAKVQHRVDLQALADHNVPCVPPLYLNDFIIADPPPDVANWLINEYKELL